MAQTATALGFIIERINRMFADDAPPPYLQPLNITYNTADALLRENRADVSEVLINGRCEEYKVGWQVFADSDTPAVNGTVASLSEGCDLTPVAVANTDAVVYASNIGIEDFVSEDDNKCGNLFSDTGNSGHASEEDAATLIAGSMMHSMAKIMGGLNSQSITFLHSGATPVNRDLSLPDTITFDATLDEFQVSDALLFQDPDFLTDVDAIVQNNRMGNYFFVNGRYAWNNAKINSQYHRLNDNERDLVRFDDYKMYFDIRNLDAALGGINSFAVTPGSYAMWNTSFSSPVPRRLSPGSTGQERWAFSIEHPTAVIFQNGRLQPLRFEVIYQRTCGGQRAGQQMYDMHTWKIVLMGGFKLSPASANTHTGILHFTGTTGV